MTTLVCPEGHQSEIPPVMYGRPGPEMWEAAERGEILIGGCIRGRPIKQPCPTCGQMAETSDHGRNIGSDAMSAIEFG